jgi:hypothetical protein
MACDPRYDLRITDGSGESHGLLVDWDKGGAQLRADKPTSLQSTAVSTKGDYGVRDVEDYFRICQTDWSAGGGQMTYDREADSESAFRESLNIDVSTVGEFRLGPGLLDAADELTTPVVLAALTDGSNVPTVYCGRSDTPYLVYSTDNVTWTACGAALGAAPACLATDGQKVYAATLGAGDGGGIVYAGDTGGFASYSADASNMDVTALAFASGTLYATKYDGTVAQLGYFDGATPSVWAALSPASGAAINLPGLTTFGLVAKGSYVYWGITGGMVTKVYKGLFVDGSADVIEEVCAFPTGFVGASMCSYLDTVYVGGHFDGTTANTGIGAIYAIIDDAPALLSDVGTDRDADNRVIAMCPYERSLYFVSGADVWRWDLVRGGYSHHCALADVGSVEVETPIAWEVDADMTAAPAAITVTNDHFTAGYNADNLDATAKCLRLYPTAADSSYQVRFNDADAAWTLDDATGETLEVALPYAFFTGHGDPREDRKSFLTFGIAGSDKGVRVVLWRKHDMCWGQLISGLFEPELLDHPVPWYKPGVGVVGGWTWDCLATLGPISLEAHTFRLTLKDAEANLYLDGVRVAGGTATKKQVPAGFLIRAESLTLPSFDMYFDNVAFTTAGAFDPTARSTITGAGLACARDAVWVPCTGTTTRKTEGYAESGELTASSTAGNMPTVDKFFSRIDVQLKKPLPAACTLSLRGVIDGGAVVDLAEDGSLSTANLRVFSVLAKGRSITPTFALTGDGTDTPEVTDTAVLFTPMPRSAKLYSYIIRCWERVEDNNGHLWDEDAATVADWLEELDGEVVTVSRPGRADFVAKVESTQWLEAPPSKRATGREGLWEISLRKV